MHHDPGGAGGGRPIADRVLAQGTANIHLIALAGQVLSRNHVHLHQKVDATLQIQTHDHGFAAQCLKPLGSGRSEVQRDDIAISQVAAQHVGSAPLIVHGGKARQYVLRAQLDLPGVKLLQAQRLGDIVPDCARHLYAPRGGDLHCRIITIKIGEGVQGPDEQQRDDQQIFPERVLIHGHSSSRAAHPAPGNCSCFLGMPGFRTT